MSDLADKLAELGFHYTAQNLDDVLAHAIKKRMAPRRMLEHIAELESAERARRSLERRQGRSKVGRFKPMADFDWQWPQRIDRSAIESVLRVSFANDARNVVLIAPQGLGKTMIAQNIVHSAVLAGQSARFITAAQLLLDLGGQESARALDRRLKYYARIGVLCIDEVGYLSYDSQAADLLYQVVAMRYEKKSLVVTTNLPFADWPTIFPNATSATALIDRLVHHAEILTIEGESYRLREAKERKAARKSTRRR